MSRLFTQPFVQAQIKENIKTLRHWPLWVEFTGDQLIPLTKGNVLPSCQFWFPNDNWLVSLYMPVRYSESRDKGRDPLAANQMCVSGAFKHDDIIKWKHFPRYWHSVRGIHRSPVNSPHKGQWRGTLMFSLICIWTNGWVNNCHADELRLHRAHYDVIVMVRLPDYKCCEIDDIIHECRLGWIILTSIIKKIDFLD